MDLDWKFLMKQCNVAKIKKKKMNITFHHFENTFPAVYCTECRSGFTHPTKQRDKNCMSVLLPGECSLSWSTEVSAAFSRSSFFLCQIPHCDMFGLVSIELATASVPRRGESITYITVLDTEEWGSGR